MTNKKYICPWCGSESINGICKKCEELGEIILTDTIQNKIELETQMTTEDIQLKISEYIIFLADNAMKSIKSAMVNTDKQEDLMLSAFKANYLIIKLETFSSELNDNTFEEAIDKEIDLYHLAIKDNNESVSTLMKTFVEFLLVNFTDGKEKSKI